MHAFIVDEDGLECTECNATLEQGQIAYEFDQESYIYCADCVEGE